MAGIVSRTKGKTIPELLDSFWGECIAAIQTNTNIACNPTEHSNFSKLFNNESYLKLFAKRRPVLLIDEIDALGTLDLYAKDIIQTNSPTKKPEQDEIQRMRRQFLMDLRAIKHESDGHCLQCVIGITNWFGNYLDLVGGSPFNVSTPIYGSYFSMEQTVELFAMYEKQEAIVVDREVIEDIYERTKGHPGQVVMLAVLYHNMRVITDREELPTASQWRAELAEDGFWRELEQSANFRRIIQTLENTLQIKSELAYWILNRDKYLKRTVVNLLQSTNIVRVCKKTGTAQAIVDFATPLVRRYICRELPHYAITPLVSLPLNESGDVDFLKLLELTIRHMNPFDILSAERKEVNDVTNRALPGPIEQAYDSQFLEVMKKLLKKYARYIY